MNTVPITTLSFNLSLLLELLISSFFPQVPDFLHVYRYYYISLFFPNVPIKSASILSVMFSIISNMSYSSCSQRRPSQSLPSTLYRLEVVQVSSGNFYPLPLWGSTLPLILWIPCFLDSKCSFLVLLPCFIGL